MCVKLVTLCARSSRNIDNVHACVLHLHIILYYLETLYCISVLSRLIFFGFVTGPYLDVHPR
jgi:hypothetical protein